MKKLAKIYLLFFGVYHLFHIMPLLGLYEFMVSAPDFLNFWEWHLILLLVYGFMPIIAVLINHSALFILVALACLAGFFIEFFELFKWTTNSYYILAFLDFLASVSSFTLAKNNRANSNRTSRVA